MVEAVSARVGPRALPWAMAGVAARIGIALFFEVGVVLLVPIVLLVAARTKLPVLAVGIPALAGLSVLHGFIPPHPGPLAAISSLKADLGLTLLFGLVAAIPTVLIAGPLFARIVVRWVPLAPPEDPPVHARTAVEGAGPRRPRRRCGRRPPAPGGQARHRDSGEPGRDGPRAATRERGGA